MTPGLKRALFWAPLALALVAALAWLFRPAAVTVDLVTVDRGPLTVSVSDEGETRVKDMYVVSAPVPGLMRRIELDVGDAVVADQTVVARIQPSDPSFLDVRSEAEARAGVEAAADFARTELGRVRALARSHTVSESDLDAAERRARTTEAALAEAQAERRVRESEYQVARARLLTPATTRERPADCECVTVYSPVSGNVLRIATESEGVVPSGTPLVEVGNPEQLEVVVDLLSADAVRVETGQRVIIEGWGGDQPLAGVVRRVEPFGFTKVSALGIEEQRVNVVIDITESR
jgi:HlyD family secretion protein